MSLPFQIYVLIGVVVAVWAAVRVGLPPRKTYTGPGYAVAMLVFIVLPLTVVAIWPVLIGIYLGQRTK